MKKFLNFLPYFLYLLGFISLILPTVYVKIGDSKVTYCFLELTFGKDMCEFSIGLFLVFILILTSVISSITLAFKNNNIITNLAIVTGFSSGILSFFQRMLSNPKVTDLNVHIGLFLPGIFILAGTIILFINKKIIEKKG
ncbi:MAG: hypothetical protein J6Y28_02290 [Acholeplasmatales bacterium]|nr:hypothetical protein [Acholeplasmatales bacterium]